MSGGLGALEAFAGDVGDDGPVCVVGGRTQWHVGGPAEPGTHEIAAPSGVVSHQPAEMIVRVRAGTTIAELQSSVGLAGQEVPIDVDDPDLATVGGVLAVGRAGFRRLGFGPVRNTVLEMTWVSAQGDLVRAGAPLVKNVTGFDLCRLLVGSLGTLGLLAEVVLRCVPLPEKAGWWEGRLDDPFSLAASLFRPASVLWDGERTWVCLAGFEADVDDQAKQVLGDSFRPVDGPPPRPGPARLSMAPAAVAAIPQRGGDPGWLAEVGVGVVHCTAEAASALAVPTAPDPAVVRIHEELKARFDPRGRLNPGRSVLSGARS